MIGTGEPISSVFSDNPEVLEYLEFGIKLTVAEVLERVPGTSRVAQPEPISIHSTGTTAIGRADCTKLRYLIQQAAVPDPELASVVILQGTATLGRLFSRSHENAQRDS